MVEKIYSRSQDFDGDDFFSLLGFLFSLNFSLVIRAYVRQQISTVTHQNSIQRTTLAIRNDILNKMKDAMLTDTGENVQKWTRAFSTRRSDASEKKRRKKRVQVWTFSPVDNFRVLACIG